MTPTEILKLSDKEFHKLVDDDLRRDATNQEHRANVSEETSKALRSPAVVDRWHSMLTRMAAQVVLQLETRVEQYLAGLARYRRQILEMEQTMLDMDPNGHVDCQRKILDLRIEMETLEADHHSAQARTLRFRTGLDQHVLEAQALRDSIRDRLYDSVVTEERNRYARQVDELKARVGTLEAAIEGHRQLMRHDEVEPTEGDRALWAVLENRSPALV